MTRTRNPLLAKQVRYHCANPPLLLTAALFQHYSAYWFFDLRNSVRRSIRLKPKQERRESNPNPRFWRP